MEGVGVGLTASRSVERRTKCAPPFRSGDLVECRGWRGRLEPGINPFGPSGRERRVLVDDLGIEYWHDPVTDIYFSSPRFCLPSLLEGYQRSNAHIDTRAYVGFDRKRWARRGGRGYQVSRLKVDLVSRFLDRGSRILDVGCHVGLFVLLARERGFRCHGIDISADAIRIGREELGIPSLSTTSIEESGFAPASFDGLMIWDVLEHIHNLLEVMQHCATVLRPGGYLFAQVPNHRGLTARLKTLAGRLHLNRGRYSHFGFPWHLYHFSRTSLDLLARRVGLEPIELRSFSHWTKDGTPPRGATGWLRERIERAALSDYLYVVARKQTANGNGVR